MTKRLVVGSAFDHRFPTSMTYRMYNDLEDLCFLLELEENRHVGMAEVVRMACQSFLEQKQIEKNPNGQTLYEKYAEELADFQERMKEEREERRKRMQEREIRNKQKQQEYHERKRQEKLNQTK